MRRIKVIDRYSLQSSVLMLCYRYVEYYLISELCDGAQPHAAWARFEMNDLPEPKNKIGLGWLKTTMFRDWNSADWMASCSHSLSLSLPLAVITVSFLVVAPQWAFGASLSPLCYFVSLWLCYTYHSLSLSLLIRRSWIPFQRELFSSWLLLLLLLLLFSC